MAQAIVNESSNWHGFDRIAPSAPHDSHHSRRDETASSSSPALPTGLAGGLASGTARQPGIRRACGGDAAPSLPGQLQCERDRPLAGTIGLWQCDNGIIHRPEPTSDEPCIGCVGQPPASPSDECTSDAQCPGDALCVQTWQLRAPLEACGSIPARLGDPFFACQEPGDTCGTSAHCGGQALEHHPTPDLRRALSAVLDATLIASRTSPSSADPRSPHPRAPSNDNAQDDASQHDAPPHAPNTTAPDTAADHAALQAHGLLPERQRTALRRAALEEIVVPCVRQLLARAATRHDHPAIQAAG